MGRQGLTGHVLAICTPLLLLTVTLTLILRAADIVSSTVWSSWLNRRVHMHYEASMGRPTGTTLDDVSRFRTLRAYAVAIAATTARRSANQIETVKPSKDASPGPCSVWQQASGRRYAFAQGQCIA